MKFQPSSLDFTFPYNLSPQLPAPRGMWALEGTWGYSKVTVTVTGISKQKCFHHWHMAYDS